MTRVVEGLQRLAKRFEERARLKVRKGQLEQALLLARQGLHFQPKHEGLLTLQQGLTGKFEQARRRQQIKELLGALSGLKRIAERYAELARSYQRKGDLRGSRAAIEQGLQAVPGHAALFDLKKDIASTNADAMEASLRKADRQFVASHLTAPRGDNALESYRHVLHMDPSNEQAKKGVHMIVQHYELLAENRQQPVACRKPWRSSRKD